MSVQDIRWTVLGSDESVEAKRSAGQPPIRLGRLTVFPGARSVEREGQPIDLGSRAFDLLMVLLQSRGTIVTKDEIMRYVWPTTVVEEANLRVQMTCLRRALGHEGSLVKTVSGRGYVAIAEEQVSAGQVAPEPSAPIDCARPANGNPSIVIINGNPDNGEAVHGLLLVPSAHLPSFVSLEAFFGSGSPVVLSFERN